MTMTISAEVDAYLEDQAQAAHQVRSDLEAQHGPSPLRQRLAGQRAHSEE